jgi:hypothetical protein
VETLPNGTIQMKPNTGYVLFMRAEQYHMPVSKLLTGQDLPYGNLEMALQNTYGHAQRRLQRQQGRGKRR